MNESYYPYTERDDRCNLDTRKLTPVRPKGYTNVAKNSYIALKTAISEGPTIVLV